MTRWHGAPASSSWSAPVATWTSQEVSWLRVVVPHLDVSSTDLRARVVDGRPLDYLVPEDVLTEIRRRRMYEAAEPASGAGAAVRGVGRGWTGDRRRRRVSAAVVVPVLALLAARTLGDSTTGTLDVPASTIAPAAETPGRCFWPSTGRRSSASRCSPSPRVAPGTAVVVPAGSLASVNGIERPTRLAAGPRRAASTAR